MDRGIYLKNVAILVVLYQQLLNDSNAVKSLLRSHLENLDIICYDNSTDLTIIERNRADSEIYKLKYVSDGNNTGLATAYNYISNYANSKNIEFILLLDQDTQITESYLMSVNRYIIDGMSEKIVAVVPKIAEQGEVFEPVHLNPLYSKHLVSAGVHQNIVTINSGTVLKNSFIRQIGGFNTEFPLDYLDHWLFYKISEQNKCVMVLSDIIEQSLSVHNIKNVNQNRYISIIQSERRYITKYRFKERAKYYRHVFMRILKLFFTGNCAKALLNIRNLVGGLK